MRAGANLETGSASCYYETEEGETNGSKKTR